MKHFVTNAVRHIAATLFSFALLWCSATVACAQTVLTGRGPTAQLLSDGRPFVILGGELGNSSASSAEDIDRIFPRLKAMGLNTVLAPAYWDLLEPQEGRFDFSLTDKVLSAARKNNLRVVFLWFGAWKNSMSCYAPEWFKRDWRRFPRAHTAEGKPLEIASAFSDEVLAADACAFETWVAHVAKEDSKHHTVLMIQVENEIGMLESARDHSPLADKAFESQVPQELIEHLTANETALHSRLRKQWTSQGRKTHGTWTEVFGPGEHTDEIFMAWHHATYVEQLAQIARHLTRVPLYVNAAMDSRGRTPGQYPSAGPLAHLKDVWHAAAPTIDILSPDIYDSGFCQWASRYALPDNPLFIPEMRRCQANGAQAFYCLAELNALGVSPFSIEDGSASDALTPAYGLLAKLSGIICAHRGRGTMRGLLFDERIRERMWTDATDSTLVITARHFFTLPWDARATSGEPWPAGGGMVVRLADDEYLVAGTGIVVEFASIDEKRRSKDNAANNKQTLGEDGFAMAGHISSQPSETNWHGCRRVGIASVDEVEVEPDGTMRRLRRLNGDEDHQGRHARIGVDDFKALRVKLYRYE